MWEHKPSNTSLLKCSCTFIGIEKLFFFFLGDIASLFDRSSFFGGGVLEQMRALLARPPRHQGVRKGVGEERGREAGAGLHLEEAGGDPSGQGREKCVTPLTSGQRGLSSLTHTHARTHT